MLPNNANLLRRIASFQARSHLGIRRNRFWQTNYIERLVEGEDVYWKDHTKWWCSYDKHETVVMDDFRSSNMRMNELLKLIDRYPHRVEVKGGFRQMLMVMRLIVCKIISVCRR